MLGGESMPRMGVTPEGFRKLMDERARRSSSSGRSSSRPSGSGRRTRR